MKVSFKKVLYEQLASNKHSLNITAFKKNKAVTAGVGTQSEIFTTNKVSKKARKIPKVLVCDFKFI